MGQTCSQNQKLWVQITWRVLARMESWENMPRTQLDLRFGNVLLDSEDESGGGAGLTADALPGWPSRIITF